MGINASSAAFLVREHARKALPETVHLVGRQTVMLDIRRAIELIRAQGLAPHTATVEIDEMTRGAKAAQSDFISDRTFFGLLGVKNVLAIDYTDYEGADVILDLNKPIAPHLQGTMQFIVGGSVLDNIFDPATYIKNVSLLLAAGGRLFEFDTLGQHNHPYCLVTPAWMFDFFVVNRFASCMTYVTEAAASGVTHVYGLVAAKGEFLSDFGPPRGALLLSIFTIAEKGPNSTSDLMPIQDQYRSEADTSQYRADLEALQHGDFYLFAQPTALDLARLAPRRSRNWRYLGAIDASDAASVGAIDPRAGLRILEATYGHNQLANPAQHSATSAIYRGNVTEILASLANGVDEWSWTVDVNLLGDPAPRTGKDLEIYYVHGSEPAQRLHRLYVPAEASGQKITLSKTLP